MESAVAVVELVAGKRRRSDDRGAKVGAWRASRRVTRMRRGLLLNNSSTLQHNAVLSYQRLQSLRCTISRNVAVSSTRREESQCTLRLDEAHGLGIDYFQGRPRAGIDGQERRALSTLERSRTETACWRRHALDVLCSAAWAQAGHVNSTKTSLGIIMYAVSQLADGSHLKT